MKGNDNKMLAITDGTLGSNIVKVDEDPEQEKRRSNILKSREIRKRSAKGPRAESRGKGSVFERLSKEPKKTNERSSIPQQSALNSGQTTVGRPSYEPDSE